MKFIKFLVVLLFSFSSLAQKKREIDFKFENDSTITQYLREKKIEYSNNQIATLKGIGTFGEFGRAKKLLVPDAYFFNSKRELIKNNGKGLYCGVEIKKPEKISKLDTDSNQTLEKFLNDINILDGSTFIDDNNYDVYIIITWAKFAAVESEASLNWFSNLKNQEKLKIKIILLNLDVQENWKLNEEQKKYLGIN